MTVRLPGASKVHRRSSLIVGQWPHQIVEVTALLARAGFDCDVVTTRSRRVRTAACRSLRQARSVDSMVRLAAEALRDDPALVAIMDDDTLVAIRDASIDEAAKLALLPVTAAEHIAHIGSKIGLSLALARAGIPTPPFRVVDRDDRLAAHADALGYPVFVKIDHYAAGHGVLECRSRADVERAARERLPLPLIVQRRIDGESIDLSGFFQDGRLVHFSHSVALRTVGGPFSPSSLKRYTRRDGVDRRIFGELTALGQALGIDGFANVTCVQEARSGIRHFIEADLRPNVWVNHPRHFGDDPADAIRDWFDHGSAMCEIEPSAGPPVTMLLPYAFRMPLGELLVNRHGAWRHLGGRTPRDLVRHVVRETAVSISEAAVAPVKLMLGRRREPRCRRADPRADAMR